MVVAKISLSVWGTSMPEKLQLLTPEEVAEILRVSPHTVQRCVKVREIEGRPCGPILTDTFKSVKILSTKVLRKEGKHMAVSGALMNIRSKLNFLFIKKEETMREKFLIWISIVVMGVFILGYQGLSQTTPQISADYAQGYQDGLAAGQRDAPYLSSAFWGFLFGPLHMIYVAITEPRVPPEVLVLLEGKSPEYKAGFLKGYKTAKQTARYIGGAIGMAVFLGLGLIL